MNYYDEKMKKMNEIIWINLFLYALYQQVLSFYKSINSYMVSVKVTVSPSWWYMVTTKT